MIECGFEDRVEVVYKYDEYPIHRFLLAIERVFSLYEWRGIRGEAAIVDGSHNVK